MSQDHLQPQPLRVAVVDDEEAGRKLLCDLLHKESGIEIVSVCNNAVEAIAVLEKISVDVVFLDVRMPGGDGFEVVRALSEPPAIVFVTAFDEFALQAFDVGAWDYLLKPFDEIRLRETLVRVRSRKQERAALERQVEDQTRRQRPLERLAIPHGRSRVTVRMEDVIGIEAESNYSRFHLDRRSHLARVSLSYLQDRLDPERFVRVHRSWIINVDHLERQEPAGHGDLSLTMDTGLRVSLSRRYRAPLEAVLEPLS